MNFQGEIENAKRKSDSMKKDIASLRKKRKEIETWIKIVETAIETDQIRPQGCYRWKWRRMWTWEDQLDSTRKLVDKIDDRIKSLEKAKYELDFWILEKEEKWNRIQPDILEAQIRQIYRDAGALSRFILGRPVPIAFDLKDEAPLGYVPVSQDFTAAKKSRLFSSPRNSLKIKPSILVIITGPC